MSLIYSNYVPLETESDTYHEAFTRLLELSDRLKIASGYISADALIYLKSVVEANGGPYIELNIGMHFFDGITKQQKEAVEELDTALRKNKLGGVFFVVTFPFHGKLISFSKRDVILGALIGSSNLTNIVKNKANRQYEVDYLLHDADAVRVEDFISQLNIASTKAYGDLDIKIVEAANSLLDDQYGVVKVSPIDTTHLKFDKAFEIPLKADGASRSNLNTFNGKGRGNNPKFVIPRSWYEVELIVPKSITSQPGYPQCDKDGDGGVIEVITDDGWEFSCKISGGNSKNFRSQKDLKILGKWMKGRLENCGALKTGELVNDATFEKYGRNTFTLARISGSNKWYLDFGVNK